MRFVSAVRVAERPTWFAPTPRHIACFVAEYSNLRSMWTYYQSTGTLSRDGETMGGGYSGFGEGKNNPAMQQLADIGPIPKGVYEIGPVHDTSSHGPHVMALTPVADTQTFGRSGFLIHGDSVADPGAASHGCIILARDVRDKISTSGDNQIEVV